MATHLSAIKRAKQALKRRDRNQLVKTNTKNAIKKARAELAGKPANANEILAAATKAAYKAVTKGVFKKKTASRYIARLSKKLAAK